MDGSWYKLMKANWERAWRIKVATAKVISCLNIGYNEGKELPME